MSLDFQRYYQIRVSVGALANALRRPTSDPAKLIRLVTSAIRCAEGEVHVIRGLMEIFEALEKPSPARAALAGRCDELLDAIRLDIRKGNRSAA